MDEGAPMTGGMTLMICLTVLGQGTVPEPPRGPVELWRALGVREPFLQSQEAREESQSLCRFFGVEDYRKLEGNPALGFYHAGGFRWVGQRVAWLGVRPVTPDAAGIPASAWDGAFQALARQGRWKVDPSAPIRIKGACVGAVLSPSAREPERGVCLELQVASPTGTLLFRYAVAKPGVEEAVKEALAWTLGCARVMDQITAPGARHVPAQP